MSIENPGELETLLRQELDKVGQRLAVKGYRCAIVASIYDGTSGATVGAGEWKDEMDRATMLLPMLQTLSRHWKETMDQLRTLQAVDEGKPT